MTVEPDRDTVEHLRRNIRLNGLDDVDMIKIYVKGSEERVWTGMSRPLDRPRPLTIFLEFNASAWPRLATS